MRPSPKVEIALYRIFHEALINIWRHADTVQCVTVSLTGDNHTMNMRVQNDGPSFDVEAALQSKRVGGLMTMRRRAELVGGTFEQTSVQGRGTSVNVSVPLN
jgi:signal transduction histidine kinase